MSVRSVGVVAAGNVMGRGRKRSPGWIDRHRRLLPALIVGGLIAALALAALRVDLIRVRYALGEAIGEEQGLVEERARLTAEVRALRDPTRLSEHAARRGFVRPEHGFELRLAPPVSTRP